MAALSGSPGDVYAGDPATAAEPARTNSADTDAALKLARKNHCLRCHAVDKKKEGPAYTFVADKYEGKPEAEEKVYQHLTSGEPVKLSDGHKENHKKPQSRSPEEIKNLVKWILSR